MDMTADEKLERIAKIVFERSLKVKRGEQVVIRTYPHTLDAADALYLAGRRIGTDPFINLIPDDAYFRALKEIDTGMLKTRNEMARSVAKTENVEIFLAGPRDPAQFRSVPYEKIVSIQNSKLNRDINKIQKSRNVRSAFLNIGQATVERAMAYGIDYEPWRNAMLDALMVDPAELAKAAKPLVAAIKRGREGVLRSREGGIFKFRLAGREPVLDDGVLRPEDIKRGDCFVHLPAGVVFAAPLEGSAKGMVAFDIPQPSRGKLVKGVWADVKKGALTGYGAAENEDEITEVVKAQGKHNMELGYFTIGVNPAAKPFFIDHQMARGVVGFHFGSNATFGGKLKDRQYYFGGFSQFATLEIDGKAIVDKGKLAVK
jgi:leucyl aminopeptidase (aminopeptidase T)